MTDEQEGRLKDGLDQLAGTQIALLQLLGLALTAHPQKDLIKQVLPLMDERFAAMHLNSQYSDRALWAAAEVWQRMTAPLRE